MRVLVLLCLVAGCTEPKKSSGTPGAGGGVRRTCGDEVLNGVEACDGARFIDGSTCGGYGLGSGTVGCTSSCTVDFGACAQSDWCSANGAYANGDCDACDALGGIADSECASTCGADGVCADRFEPLAGVRTCANAGLTDPDCGTCGNGVLEGNEPCDGSAVPDACADYGFAGGTLGCTADCMPDFTRCTLRECGNGTLDPGELCDGAILGNLSCADQGYAGGQMACRNCMPDSSGCLSDGDVTTFVTAICDLILGCESALGPMVASHSLCVEMYGCLFRSFLSGTSADMAACTSFYQSLSCSDLANPDAIDTLPGAQACDRVFGSGSATIAGEGVGCLGRVQCDEGLYCGAQQGSCVVCAAYQQLYDSCTYSFECDPATLYCEVVTDRCSPKKAAGEPCDGNQQCLSENCAANQCRDPVPENGPCDPGLDECEAPFSCVQGLCQSLRRVGQSCDTSEDCVLGALCSGTCTVMIFECGGGALNEPCSTGGCSEGWCNESDICAPFLGVGDECSWDGACGPLAYCDWRQTPFACALRASPGEPCEMSSACLDGMRCIGSSGSRTCAWPTANGQSCTDSEDCESYYCMDGICADGTACVP